MVAINNGNNIATYATGAIAGGVAGAASMLVYTKFNPFFFINVPALASEYILGDNLNHNPDTKTILLAGAIVGAVAGVVRTAVDRHWPNFQQFRKRGDCAIGFLAAPLAPVFKCVVFPMFDNLWKAPQAAFLHMAACGTVGGIAATFLSPVAMVASAASRLAVENIQ